MVDRDGFASLAVELYQRHLAVVAGLVADAERSRSISAAIQLRGALARQRHAFAGEVRGLAATLGRDGVADSFAAALTRFVVGEMALADRHGMSLASPVGIPSGYYHDARNRRWKGAIYVRTLARHAAVQVDLATAMNLGMESVTVMHPDPEHRHHGATVSLDDYEQIAEVFHPNSNARIRFDVQT